MKTFLSFLAFGLCAAAQVSMVGTPDATIEGSPRNPTMTNRSSKTILATLLATQRVGEKRPVYITKLHKAGVAPGATVLIGMSPHAHTERPEDEPQILSATLKAVMFTDGEVRGDDPTGKFKANVQRLQEQGQVHARQGQLADLLERKYHPESYYTFLHPFDVYHSACSSNCLFTDPYGLGVPGSPLIGVTAGCQPNHAYSAIGINFQASPESGAVDPWWSGNAGDDFSLGGVLFSRGSCGDYAFSEYGEWNYQRDCDTGDQAVVDTTAGIC